MKESVTIERGGDAPVASGREETTRPPVAGKYPSATALATSQLEKSYGRRRVVDDVTLHVEQGEVVGLLGVAWLIVYYVAGQDVPLMSDLGNWNILIGMGGMAAAFGLATLWR